MIRRRVFGSKGLWSIMPITGDINDEPTIIIRKSQRKSRHLTPHRTHLIFNLVRTPHVSEASVTRQTILNLSAHGVPNKVFIERMKEFLDARVAPLLKFDGPGAMLNLSHFIQSNYGSSGRRLRHLTGAKSRVLGHSHIEGSQIGIEAVDENDGEAEPEDVAELEEDDITATLPSIIDRDPTSGFPFNPEERLLHLAAAGFNPKTEPYLHSTIDLLLQRERADFLKKYAIPIPRSAQAWIIPGLDSMILLPKFHVYCDIRSSRSVGKG